MKFVLLVLLSLSIMSCASNRSPSSVDQQEDVRHGINTDYYGTR